MVRVLKTAALLALAVIVVQSLPDLKRYLQLREM
jgi:hypothetical protein